MWVIPQGWERSDPLPPFHREQVQDGWAGAKGLAQEAKGLAQETQSTQCSQASKAPGGCPFIHQFIQGPPAENSPWELQPCPHH